MPWLFNCCNSSAAWRILGGPFPLKINGSWVFKSLKWIWNLQPRDVEKHPSLNTRLKLLLPHQHCHDPTDAAAWKFCWSPHSFSLYVMLRDSYREIKLFAGLLQTAGKFLWRQRRMLWIYAVSSWVGPALLTGLSSYLLSHLWMVSSNAAWSNAWLQPVPFPTNSAPCCPLCYNFRVKWNDSGSWELLLTHRGHRQSKTHHQKGKSLKFRGERQHTKEFLLIFGDTERWFSHKHIFGQFKIFWTGHFSLCLGSLLWWGHGTQTAMSVQLPLRWELASRHRGSWGRIFLQQFVLVYLQINLLTKMPPSWSMLYCWIFTWFRCSAFRGKQGNK